MPSADRWLSASGTWRRALLAGAVASLAYAGVVLGYAAHPSTPVSIPGPLWGAVAWYALLASGTVGTPVVLWLRYGLRAPVALLACILAFWHVLVEVPPLGTGAGDSPGFTFVFFFAPFYLVAYGLLAAAEYWLRNRTAG